MQPYKRVPIYQKLFKDIKKGLKDRGFPVPDKGRLVLKIPKDVRLYEAVFILEPYVTHAITLLEGGSAAHTLAGVEVQGPLVSNGCIRISDEDTANATGRVDGGNSGIFPENQKTPTDPITLDIAVNKFHVSRGTIKRYIANSKIKTYRKEDASRTSKHIVSESELEKYWSRKT